MQTSLVHALFIWLVQNCSRKNTFCSVFAVLLVYDAGPKGACIQSGCIGYIHAWMQFPDLSRRMKERQCES